jgi:hypothetical protein
MSSVPWDEVSQRWEPLLNTFRSEGYEIAVSSVAFPLQVAGRLPSGEPFYFRERSGRCFLGVGGSEPDERPIKRIERIVPTDRGNPTFLEPHDAAQTLRAMLALLRSGESVK